MYVGDPCNTVRIFNELEVDELLFLDITASTESREPNFQLLSDIASECFMPFAYGGGIRTFSHAKQIFDIGFEKIAINTHSFENIHLISELSDYFGSQSIIASIDVKTSVFGTQHLLAAKKRYKRSPLQWAKYVESAGAGEILLTSVNHEGTWKGFDIPLVQCISNGVIFRCSWRCRKFTAYPSIEWSCLSGSSRNMVVFQRKGLGFWLLQTKQINSEWILTTIVPLPFK